MNRYEFGKYLRAKRKEMGKTLKEMAATADISVDHLRRFEKGGIERPGTSALQKLAEAYKIPLRQVSDVFYKDDARDKQLTEKLDNILRSIQDDKVFKAKGSAIRHTALSQLEISADVKLLIISLYEQITGKKML